MRKGCQIFAVTVNPPKIGETKLNHCFLEEYMDVFPKEIPRMPPKRDIDFHIDLVPGA